MSFSHTIPLSLYIHMPWCVRKCPYCDFNSHHLKNDLPEKIYIDTLIRDLQNDISKVAGRTISSIFIGGGTPSLFSPEAIARLLKEVQQHIAFTPAIEITLEANPGTVDQDRFVGFSQAGVNRLSIGIQSFQAEKLKALGRIHDDHAALRAAQAARSAGFTRFNLDLMHGLPDQTIAEATADIETALGFSPPHLSWYQLTIEPNTLFHHRPPVLPDDTILGSIQEQGHDILLTHGYQHYEVSAYCLPDYECNHNLNYWQFGDYLGIGAGAHSKITDMQQQSCSRFWKLKNPQDYLKANDSFIGDENIIAKKDLPFEFMLNALRLQKSISTQLYTERTGLEINSIESILNHAQDKQLLEWNHLSFTPTALGRRFLNDLTAMFME